MNRWNQAPGRASVPTGQPPGGYQPGAGYPTARHSADPQLSGPPQPAPYPRVPAPAPGLSPAAPASPAGGPAISPPAPAPPVPADRRRSWSGVVALALVAVLTIALGLQTWQLYSVSGDLERATERLEDLTQGQAYAGERLGVLEDRASELERIAGEVFDSEAVAAAVLPSVFMVVAGPFSGTAFAVGPAGNGGGTNLFTNYHVIEDVWLRGETRVTLQRTNQSYPAEIVDVEPGNDVAWLRTDSSFSGLAPASEEVRAGQPIIAVGAPQGLTDTVTSGVVSTPAQRLPDGSGPWIQFDAAINPGNSGGPVINSSQEVVGIATAKGRETEGIGFAVPIETACGLFDIC